MKSPLATALLLLVLLLIAGLTAACAGKARPYHAPDAVTGATDLTLGKVQAKGATPVGALGK